MEEKGLIKGSKETKKNREARKVKVRGRIGSCKEIENTERKQN
jgi:hypothetical protein